MDKLSAEDNLPSFLAKKLSSQPDLSISPDNGLSSQVNLSSSPDNRLSPKVDLTTSPDNRSSSKAGCAAVLLDLTLLDSDGRTPHSPGSWAAHGERAGEARARLVTLRAISATDNDIARGGTQGLARPRPGMEVDS